MKPNNWNNEIKIFGLTGGVASGKSTVAALLRREGVPVVDADHAGREILERDSEVRKKVLARFGTLERSELRNKIFSNKGEKKALEEILHPIIRKKCFETLTAHAERLLKEKLPWRVVIYEAALLFESGTSEFLDGIVVVDCNEEEQISRLIARDKITREQAESILRNQTTRTYRQDHATLIIDNSGDKVALEKKIIDLLRFLPVVEVSVPPEAREFIQNNLRTFLGKKGITGVLFSVFGSRLSTHHRPDSDLDLLIEPGDKLNDADFGELVEVFKGTPLQFHVDFMRDKDLLPGFMEKVLAEKKGFFIW